MWGMATETEKARFAAALSKLREASGMSQADVISALAERHFTIRQQSYGDYERGRSVPQGRAAVVALEDVLDGKGELLAALGFAPVSAEDWIQIKELRERIEAIERAGGIAPSDAATAISRQRRSGRKRASS